MFPILFNRKDTCHICQLHIFRSFKKSPQKVKIRFLYFLPFFRESEYAVPLVNDENKSLSGTRVYLAQDAWQSILILLKTGTIFRLQIFNDRFLDFINKDVKMGGVKKESLDIKPYNIMFI